jgi:parvulin-like peptidyl-prolyl isomerase
MSASREKKLRKEAQERGPDLSAKEKQKRQDNFRRAVVITIAAVFVLSLCTLLLIGSGVMPANMTALTIDGVKISGAEFDFHYFNSFYQTWQMYVDMGIIEWLGIDPNRSLRRQDMGDGRTWADYFEEMAVNSLTAIVAQSEAARREGVSLTAEDRENINDTLEQLERLADANNMSTDRVLRNQYGRGINTRSYRAILERIILSSRYEIVTTEAFGFTDEDFEAYYAENREQYDFIDYHAFTLEDKEKAEEMLARVTTGDAFRALSREFALEEEHEHDEDCAVDHEHDENCEEDCEIENDYICDDDDDDDDDEAEDTTLFERRAASAVNAPIGEFLLDTSRRAGDKTIAVNEDEDEFTVLLFIGRYRDETISVESIDVRHILISTEQGAFADDSEGALARAEEILQEWKDGAADEDFFAELAKEHTADGNGDVGGLYEKVAPGRMVETFNDWCFDLARRPGDTGIVETRFGYHIMYFVQQHGELQPAWLRAVTSDKNFDAMTAHRENLVEAQGEPKRRWFGMIFTKTISN